jgi:hypothetical protein
MRCRLHEALQPVLADLVADPEGHGRSNHRANRGQDRVKPEELRFPGRQNNHREVDPERQKEHD